MTYLLGSYLSDTSIFVAAALPVLMIWYMTEKSSPSTTGSLSVYCSQ
jgi:uncharacterized membrane-anchored protein